jgi:hypothetical protein
MNAYVNRDCDHWSFIFADPYFSNKRIKEEEKE